MNNISIRHHIINNFKNDDINTIKNAIEESIKEQDELSLPGMGVFLEIIWNNASNELKNEMLKIIETKVKG